MRKAGLDYTHRGEAACYVVIIRLTQFDVQAPVLYHRVVMLHHHYHQPSKN